MNYLINKKGFIYFYCLFALVFYFSGIFTFLVPLPFMISYYSHGRNVLVKVLIYFFLGFCVFLFFLSKVSDNTKYTIHATIYEILYVVSICISTYVFLLSSSKWTIRLLKATIFPSLVTFFQVYSLRLNSDVLITRITNTLVETMPQIKQQGDVGILINTALSFIMLIILASFMLFLLINRYFVILIIQRKLKFSLHTYLSYVYRKIVKQMNKSHLFIFLMSLGIILIFYPHTELKTFSFISVLLYAAFNLLFYTLFCYFIYGSSLVYMYIQKYKYGGNMLSFLSNAHWYFFFILCIIIMPAINCIAMIGFITIGLINNILKFNINNKG